MDKENLFLYEEDGFCELRYTYGDLTKFERKSKKYDKLQSNWNSLREYIGAEWYCFDNESVEHEVANNILDKMNELEGVDND